MGDIERENVLNWRLMKKLMSAFFILLIGIASNAQDAQKLPPFSEPETSWEKIQVRELPKAVRESLTEPDYAGWTIVAAYKALITDPERPESAGLIVYFVELKRRDERAMIKFDKEGKRLDENDNR